MTDAQLITSAAAFAAEAHSGQLRKELNVPYIEHPLRVAALAARYGMSPFAVAAANLHDVVEDTKTPMATVAALFPPETVALVTVLTKWWEDGHAVEVVAANKEQYYAQILRTPEAPTLKVLDRIDNLYDFAKMARMAASTHRWAARYYTKTEREFVPVLKALDTEPKPENAEKLRTHFAAAMSALKVALQ